MANEQNLMSVQELNARKTPEERSESARKAGIASGAARRKKRSMQQSIKMIMNLGVDEATAKTLEKLGIATEDQTILSAINVAMAMKAMRGDTAAAGYLAKYSGEDPRDKMEKKRLDNELKQEKGVSSAIDDWISSIPDVEE